MYKGEKTILIVEDDKLNREALTLYLKKKYRTEVCDSEKTFYQILSTKKIDLIIMDISLNGSKNGLVLTKEVRENPAYNHIPILCLTAHARQTDERNAFSAGVDVFITKPVKNEKVLEIVNEWMQKKQDT